MSLDDAARKYALQNAVQHGGNATPGAVIGRIMAEMPELRGDPKAVAQAAGKAVSEVNSLCPDEQREELGKAAPDLLEKKKKEKVAELSELPNSEGGVTVRFAPGPSGPLHIGHTRAAVLNDEYVKRYGGKFILRLEDTNPVKIDPGAYEMIPEDLKWLGIDIHETYIQSDRFDIYLEYAKKLLDMGHAYICSCNVEDWREKKNHNLACPHRDLSPDVQALEWEKLLDGTYGLNEASYVVKTDLQHPNPAVRDFVGLRIVDEPHPRTGSKYSLYPMYNFSVAIDDHLMGMTHVLRGKDHLNNTTRQEYIYDYFGWKKPGFIHYGWVSIEDTILKTSLIKEKIMSGEYSGWDDHRLGTLRGIARRGISPEALRRYWIEVGTKAVDISFSWKTLYAYNKELVDDGADRLFFVENQRLERILDVDVDGGLVGSAPVHPDHPDRGAREASTEFLEEKGGKTERVNAIYTSSAYLDEGKPGDVLRFKDLGNVRITPEKGLIYIGNALSVLKEGAKIVEWVGPSDAVETELHMPDGSVKMGVAEKKVLDYHGKVVQFEKVGFARIELSEAVGGKLCRAFFAHR